MNELLFVEKREGDWKRLNLLCEKSDASPRNLTREELREFVKVYRRVSSDLALVRTQSSNLQLVDFLNDLVGRAYMSLYRPRRGSLWKGIGDAIGAYAQTIRRLKWFVFLSMTVFFLGVFMAAGLVAKRPDLKGMFVPAGQWEEVMKQWKYGDMEERTGGDSVGATLFYAGNNPRVAMVTGGKAAATFGILTTQSLFENGALLGVLAHDLSEVRRVGYLILHVSPHGVTEISGLIIASAGGYAMAWAVISPGRRKRGDALLAAAKDALVVYIGGVTLMFIAAPIEGFLSFNPAVPSFLKVIFAIGSLIAWLAFYIGYGKVEPVLTTHAA